MPACQALSGSAGKKKRKRGGGVLLNGAFPAPSFPASLHRGGHAHLLLFLLPLLAAAVNAVRKVDGACLFSRRRAWLVRFSRRPRPASSLFPAAASTAVPSSVGVSLGLAGPRPSSSTTSLALSLLPPLLSSGSQVVNQAAGLRQAAAAGGETGSYATAQRRPFVEK